MLCLWFGWADQHAATNMKRASVPKSRRVPWICRQTLFGQLLLGLIVLTVLGVCVAEHVLAVRVAAVVVMNLARVGGLILLDAELMVWGETAEREAEDDTCNQNKFTQWNATCHYYQLHFIPASRMSHTKPFNLWREKTVYDGNGNSQVMKDSLLQLWTFLFIWKANGIIPKGIMWFIQVSVTE